MQAASRSTGKQKTATCPGGEKSVGWNPTHDQHGKDVIHVRLLRAPLRLHELQGLWARHTLRPKQQHEALQAARARQQTEEFWELYAARAGGAGIRTAQVPVHRASQAAPAAHHHRCGNQPGARSCVADAYHPRSDSAITFHASSSNRYSYLIQHRCIRQRPSGACGSSPPMETKPVFQVSFHRPTWRPPGPHSAVELASFDNTLVFVAYKQHVSSQSSSSASTGK